MRDALIRRSLRIFAAFVFAAMLTACNPCDYYTDTSKPYGEPVKVELPTSEQNAETKRKFDIDEAELKKKMSPEQWAAREEMKNRIRAESERNAKEREAQAAAGTLPKGRFEKATLTQCAMRYGSDAAVYLIGLLVCAAVLQWLSKRLTGRGLVSWITGKKPQ